MASEAKATTTWWKVSKYASSPTPVEVLRETDHYLITAGWRGQESRTLKSSGYAQFFRTQGEGLSWLANMALKERTNAQWVLEQADKKVAELQRLYPDLPEWKVATDGD